MSGFTSVTIGPITDFAGNIYVSARVIAALDQSVLPAGSGPPLLGGQSVFQTIVIGDADSFGQLVLTLADVNQISPSGCVWDFTVVNATGTVGFTLQNQVITGAAQDISSAIRAAAASLNPPTGFGSITTVSIANSTGITTLNLLATGFIFMANGSVGSPALAFNSDSGTGFYRIGASRMGLALGGVNGLDLQALLATFAGVVNAITGFRINGLAAANRALIGDGTNFVSTALALASAQFANQGTTTTVLHGNAAGNPSFAVVTPADAVGNTSGSGNFVLVTSPTIATPVISGTVTSYNGVVTADFGHPTIYGTPVHLTGQTANLAATSIYPAPVTGLYVINVQCRTTTSGSGTTATFTLTWADEGGAKSFTSGTFALNSVTITGVVTTTIPIHVNSGTAVQIAVTGTFGTSVYAVDAWVERIT